MAVAAAEALVIAAIARRDARFRGMLEIVIAVEVFAGNTARCGGQPGQQYVADR